MKLQWIPSTTLSLLRMVQWISWQRDLKDASLQKAIQPAVQDVCTRLINASIDPAVIWEHLIDEAIAQDNDVELSPALCEIALIRGGHSDLQSDQTAMAIHRSLETCRRAFTTRSPRLADQLRLRYAPLKQAYESYGPGLVRSVGKAIWNGSPPTDWWPSRVSVHAVQPIANGAAGASSQQASVWIEAVLTDMDPDVPEWLRLVYQLTCMAISSHTRTHNSSSGTRTSSDTATGEAGTSSELPWTTAIVPLILSKAADAGMIPSNRFPLAKALSMWQPELPSAKAPIVERWWEQVGLTGQPTPIALKQLAAALSAHNSSDPSTNFHTA
ncbi:MULTISPECIES: hypothetical protein [Rhodopirellula]|uniref:Uncharacterized protein n=1 Tax=Rhodopirellula europaea SH398 TaxID=1263868 RepID=M5S7B3_9BACT|nr:MULTISPECIES: hypothetical protein [Rhodopirellula]EMI27380.1 hypothetical protein RESH_02038 [Rhodopirellula europaea SH398]